MVHPVDAPVEFEISIGIYHICVCVSVCVYLCVCMCVFEIHCVKEGGRELVHCTSSQQK